MDWVFWPINKLEDWDNTDICSVSGVASRGKVELRLLHDRKRDKYLIRFGHTTWTAGFQMVCKLLMFFYGFR